VSREQSVTVARTGPRGKEDVCLLVSTGCTRVHIYLTDEEANALAVDLTRRVDTEALSPELEADL